VFVHCAECQTEVPPPGEKCPACGSEDIMVGMYTPSGMLVSAQQGPSRIRLQARKHEDRTRYEAAIGSPPIPLSRPPGVAPHLKMYSEIKWNYDRNQLERREMLVDSENDYYRQEWFSLETGERTYFKEGRLSDPGMHGRSARRGKAGGDN
jgi:RNA polymerase subunit RPABC4/transcription elongation factor Spt4